MAQIFAEIARVTDPMPIYGFTRLPTGAHIPDSWWPVSSLADPAGYEGPAAPNPRISARERGTEEVQLVLALNGGWLLILENFRGDLGDVVGRPAGEVAGRPATAYSLNGGTLVQWSDQGRWYGVFGRALPAEDVIRLALSMAPVAPAH